jgi:4-carboxymuconolactone decarboxylase
MSQNGDDKDAYRRGWEVLKSLDESVARGVTDSLAPIVPDLAELVVSYGFGTSYSRPALNPRDRQLVTLGALIALGAESQIAVHAALAAAAGVSRQELREVFIHSAVYCGFPRAISGARAAGHQLSPDQEEH